jgi:hypothetical protein
MPFYFNILFLYLIYILIGPQNLSPLIDPKPFFTSFRQEIYSFILIALLSFCAQWHPRQTINHANIPQ